MRLQTLSSQAAHEVSKFSNFLLRVGEGTEPEDDNQMIHIDNKFVVPGDSIKDLVTSVYGDIKENYADRDYVSQKIILCPKNDTSDRELRNIRTGINNIKVDHGWNRSAFDIFV